jgi:preprotein translocase subunit SecA
VRHLFKCLPIGPALAGYRTKSIDRINSHRRELHVVSDDELKAIARNAHTLPETFAVTALLAERILGFKMFDVQLRCALAIADGKIAEMQTGEGKTLSAVPTVVWLARAGKGVHIMTVNDYLARRDSKWMKPIYAFFGLSVGCIQQDMDCRQRKEAYACDITYATANEIGFDFLRDQTALFPEDQVHRPFAAAVIDEADSILIDEARIPLVLAGGQAVEATLADRVDQFTRNFTQPLHFTCDEYARNIALTDAGIQAVEDAFRCLNLYAEENLRLLIGVQDSIHARALLRRDIDYVVQNQSIKSIDEFKGRIVKERRWPAGLQAALEAKEGVAHKAEGKVLASITLQNLISLYPETCGMTGTAATQADELHSIYSLEVEVIPPNRPNIRVDLPDRIFATKQEKEQTVAAEVRRIHETGQPVLVGTSSVQESERLSAQLTDIPHHVLNARNEEEEAGIIARAGEAGAVTISTNMAGRGTDIRLGNGVDRLGGLFILGTNRHESRRIDNQLRGRAGRQGDPGSSQFFVSLEDDLLVKFGINDPEVHHTPESIQRLIEGQHLETRKFLAKYEYVIEGQRQAVQQRRQSILSGRTPCSSDLERLISLATIDEYWAEHLEAVAELRNGSQWVSLGGKDPLHYYLKTVHQMFEESEQTIDEEIVKRVAETRESGLSPVMERGATWTYLTTDQPFGSMQERFIRGMIAKIKEQRTRKAAYLKAPNQSGHSSPELTLVARKGSGRKASNRLAAIMLTLVLGSLMWLRREHLEVMLRAVHYPLLVSFGLWIAFTLYWNRESIGDSAIARSESRGSRFIHEILVNTAFLLLFLQIFPHIPGLAHRFLPASRILTTAGLVLQIAMFILAIWARFHLGRHWRGVIAILGDHQLIRSGPYRLVRHPIYTAMLGMIVGTAIVSGGLYALLGVVFATVAYWRKIRIEEHYLHQAFGEEYAEYSRITPALIPLRVMRSS